MTHMDSWAPGMILSSFAAGMELHVAAIIKESQP